MTRIIYLPMPEGGAEKEVVFYRHHMCKNSKEFKKAMDNPDVDRMQFSVGLFGEGMPPKVAFAVNSTNPCEVCGSYATLWFAWNAPMLFIP
jgi:hypothetical protein